MKEIEEAAARGQELDFNVNLDENTPHAQELKVNSGVQHWVYNAPSRGDHDDIDPTESKVSTGGINSVPAEDDTS